MRVDYEPILDIRAIKRDSQPTIIIPEILKYCVKESDLICNRKWFLELTNQTHKLRNVATGGIIKEYLRQLEQDREYEIEQIDIEHLYFELKNN